MCHINKHVKHVENLQRKTCICNISSWKCVFKKLSTTNKVHHYNFQMYPDKCRRCIRQMWQLCIHTSTWLDPNWELFYHFWDLLVCITVLLLAKSGMCVLCHSVVQPSHLLGCSCRGRRSDWADPDLMYNSCQKILGSFSFTFLILLGLWFC